MDEADSGNEAAEIILRDQLSVRKSFIKLNPKKECYNCEAELYDEAIYCNQECTDEHKWYLERKKGNRYVD